MEDPPNGSEEVLTSARRQRILRSTLRDLAEHASTLDINHRFGNRVRNPHPTLYGRRGTLLQSNTLPAKLHGSAVRLPQSRRPVVGVQRKRAPVTGVGDDCKQDPAHDLGAPHRKRAFVPPFVQSPGPRSSFTARTILDHSKEIRKLDEGIDTSALLVAFRRCNLFQDDTSPAGVESQFQQLYSAVSSSTRRDVHSALTQAQSVGKVTDTAVFANRHKVSDPLQSCKEPHMRVIGSVTSIKPKNREGILVQQTDGEGREDVHHHTATTPDTESGDSAVLRGIGGVPRLPADVSRRTRRWRTRSTVPSKNAPPPVVRRKILKYDYVRSRAVQSLQLAHANHEDDDAEFVDVEGSEEAIRSGHAEVIDGQTVWVDEHDEDYVFGAGELPAEDMALEQTLVENEGDEPGLSETVRNPVSYLTRKLLADTTDAMESLVPHVLQGDPSFAASLPGSVESMRGAAEVWNSFPSMDTEVQETIARLGYPLRAVRRLGQEVPENVYYGSCDVFLESHTTMNASHRRVRRFEREKQEKRGATVSMQLNNEILERTITQREGKSLNLPVAQKLRTYTRPVLTPYMRTRLIQWLEKVAVWQCCVANARLLAHQWRRDRLRDIMNGVTDTMPRVTEDQQQKSSQPVENQLEIEFNTSAEQPTRHNAHGASSDNTFLTHSGSPDGVRKPDRRSVSSKSDEKVAELSLQGTPKPVHSEAGLLSKKHIPLYAYPPVEAKRIPKVSMRVVPEETQKQFVAAVLQPAAPRVVDKWAQWSPLEQSLYLFSLHSQFLRERGPERKTAPSTTSQHKPEVEVPVEKRLVGLDALHGAHTTSGDHVLVRPATTVCISDPFPASPEVKVAKRAGLGVGPSVVHASSSSDSQHTDGARCKFQALQQCYQDAALASLRLPASSTEPRLLAKAGSITPSMAVRAGLEDVIHTHSLRKVLIPFQLKLAARRKVLGDIRHTVWPKEDGIDGEIGVEDVPITPPPATDNVANESPHQQTDVAQSRSQGVQEHVVDTSIPLAWSQCAAPTTVTSLLRPVIDGLVDANRAVEEQISAAAELDKRGVAAQEEPENGVAEVTPAQRDHLDKQLSELQASLASFTSWSGLINPQSSMPVIYSHIKERTRLRNLLAQSGTSSLAGILESLSTVPSLSVFPAGTRSSLRFAKTDTSTLQSQRIMLSLESMVRQSERLLKTQEEEHSTMLREMERNEEKKNAEPMSGSDSGDEDDIVSVYESECPKRSFREMCSLPGFLEPLLEAAVEYADPMMAFVTSASRKQRRKRSVQSERQHEGVLAKDTFLYPARTLNVDASTPDGLLATHILGTLRVRHVWALQVARVRAQLHARGISVSAKSGSSSEGTRTPGKSMRAWTVSRLLHQSIEPSGHSSDAGALMRSTAPPMDSETQRNGKPERSVAQKSKDKGKKAVKKVQKKKLKKRKKKKLSKAPKKEQAVASIRDMLMNTLPSEQKLSVSSQLLKELQRCHRPSRTRRSKKKVLGRRGARMAARAVAHMKDQRRVTSYAGSKEGQIFHASVLQYRFQRALRRLYDMTAHVLLLVRMWEAAAWSEHRQAVYDLRKSMHEQYCDGALSIHESLEQWWTEHLDGVDSDSEAEDDEEDASRVHSERSVDPRRVDIVRPASEFVQTSARCPDRPAPRALWAYLKKRYPRGKDSLLFPLQQKRSSAEFAYISLRHGLSRDMQFLSQEFGWALQDKAAAVLSDQASEDSVPAHTPVSERSTTGGCIGTTGATATAEEPAAGGTRSAEGDVDGDSSVESDSSGVSDADAEGTEADTESESGPGRVISMEMGEGKMGEGKMPFSSAVLSSLSLSSNSFGQYVDPRVWAAWQRQYGESADPPAMSVDVNPTMPVDVNSTTPGSRDPRMAVDVMGSPRHNLARRNEDFRLPASMDIGTVVVLPPENEGGVA